MARASILAFGLFPLILTTNCLAALIGTAAQPWIQNFNSMPSASPASFSAPLPADWRAGLSTSTERAVFAAPSGWTSTANKTTVDTASTSYSTTGIYNLGSSTDASDRALGFLTDNSKKAGNLYAMLTVPPDSGLLDGVRVGFDVEQYRAGTNTNGFAVQMFWSRTGSGPWTSAGDAFRVTFAAGATGGTGAPRASITVEPTAIAVTLSPGEALYLAWNFTLATSTLANPTMPVLGLDNVTIAGIAPSNAPEPAAGAAAAAIATTALLRRRRPRGG
ncbi:MAG TPA: hypothetical protein VK324_01605 [Tepidisphaeraceae bacterium]|nr:hypothetical protein [Tepidisphaeraceae bacterium]